MSEYETKCCGTGVGEAGAGYTLGNNGEEEARHKSLEAVGQIPGNGEMEEGHIE